MNGKYTISERIDYRVTSHEKKFDSAEYNNCKNGKVFRMEEWICKECKGKYFDAVGKIVDYQVPLKQKLKSKYNQWACGEIGRRTRFRI